MEKNLFQQAKDLWENFMNENAEHAGHAHTEGDRAAVKAAIDKAYQEATPDEQQQLQQFENDLDGTLR